MVVERYEDVEALSRTAAERFARTANEAIERRGRFRVALAGGQTPKRLYGLLSMPPFRGRVPWSYIDFFWGDERTVPPEHAESNFRLANETMLRPLQIDCRQVHRIDAMAADPGAAAAEYQRTIATVFAVQSGARPPRFDLVLLGLGRDGHTASLFPNTAALDERERWVVANRVQSLGTVRFTMTAPILNRARLVVFLVTGADKADALRFVLKGPRDPVRWPAQLIHPVGQLVWMVDHAAAARLGALENRDGPHAGSV